MRAKEQRKIKISLGSLIALLEPEGVLGWLLIGSLLGLDDLTEVEGNKVGSSSLSNNLFGASDLSARVDVVGLEVVVGRIGCEDVVGSGQVALSVDQGKNGLRAGDGRSIEPARVDIVERWGKNSNSDLGEGLSDGEEEFVNESRETSELSDGGSEDGTGRDLDLGGEGTGGETSGGNGGGAGVGEDVHVKVQGLQLARKVEQDGTERSIRVLGNTEIENATSSGASDIKIEVIR